MVYGNQSTLREMTYGSGHLSKCVQFPFTARVYEDQSPSKKQTYG